MNSLLKSSVIFKNVLPSTLYYDLARELNYGWNINNASEKGDIVRCWGKTEHDFDCANQIYKASTTIQLLVKKVLKTHLFLDRLHVNGQTCGQPSLFHEDGTEEGYYTFVLFTAPRWNTNWGGEFVVFNPFTNEYEYVPYIPNSGVLIDSRWSHKGSHPDNITYDLRTSIAFMFGDWNNPNTKPHLHPVID